MHPIKRGTYIGLALLVFVLTILASSAVAFAAPTFNRPIDNRTHVANSISLSTTAFSSGVPAAVVASADAYADSLTAAVLARAYSGPLLLSSAGSLSANVAAELSRLKPQRVFLVGLPSSFAGSVKAAVSGLTDDDVIVLKGADRYETAALVAAAVKDKVGTVSKVVIAPGDSYGFALAASSLAAAQGWPLLLMPSAGPLPRSAKDAISDLGVKSGIVVGTDATLGVGDGFTVTKRIIGKTGSGDSDGRYDTAAELADYAVDQGWLSYSHLGIVSGGDYPDGEATVAFLAKDKGVLLFSKSSALQASTSASIKAHGSEIKKVDIVGLGWAVYREVKSLNSGRVNGLSSTEGPTAGGNKLVITGTALNKVTKVRVGKKDVPSSDWHVDSATQITISTVPSAYGDGPVEVTVFNYWGASPSSTKDLYWYGGAGAQTAGEKVVQKAVQYLGVPYLWAGSSPSTGFDCSGFCMYVYKQFGVSLPHYSRAMSAYGTAVSKDDLQPGDLVFYYTPISHVAMYVGGGMMINAPRSGDLVDIEDVFRSGYVTARRMIASTATAPAYTRYEQTDSLLAYSGTWNASRSSSASAGNFSYSDTAGSSVTIAFNGTYLGLVTKKSSVYGIAKITVDGRTPVTLDLYSANTLWQQKVWNTGTLSTGEHTVTIEWTGKKNASASATNVGIDAVEIKGFLTKADPTANPPAASGDAVRYEQTDSRIAYSGTWSTSRTSAASGGNFRYADKAGATVSIAFEGTSLTWVTKTSNVYGIAKVTVDGGTSTLVDLYSADTRYQQKIWQTGTLSAGKHTVTVEWTGTKNPASSATNIGIDAVEVVGEAIQASAVVPAPATTRYEQTDSRIAYSGTWVTFSTVGASGGGYARARVNGASATIKFSGQYLAWIATKGTTLGKAKVSLDGGTATTVDLAASVVAYQQKVWDTGTIADGVHTVTITWDGGNTSKYISLDAVEVAGSLTSATAAPTTPTTPATPTATTVPATTRYEQQDSRFTFSGGWIASSSSLASRSSFRFADSPARATATFKGSYLAWIAKKSPVYGKAKVTLDGGSPITVDLYSASTVWQQKVWDTGVLPAGEHTVVIEWTGVKSPGALGTNVNVDALEISGTVIQAPAAATVRYEQNDSRFAYVGSWSNSRTSAASGGSFYYSNADGSSVTVSFTGSYLAWIAKKSPVYGKAEVTLDGGAPQTVDLYSAGTSYKQKVWDTGTLVPGRHTVTIEWTGVKSAAATDTNIGADAFEIVGTLR